jgi:hypothetical protein
MEILMKHLMRKTTSLAVAMLLGLTACADLDVVNPNAANAERALGTPGDVESLVAGSFRSWWLSSHHQNSGAPINANASFMFASWPANFGMVFYSQIPRVAIVNLSTDTFYNEAVGYVWNQNYRALSAVAQGLAALGDPEVTEGLGASRVLRARAFGKFMQGMAHGSLALHYSQAWIVDENSDLFDDMGVAIPQQLHPYEDVMDAALGYFDDAIALAEGASFTTPAGWMSVAVSASDLARIAHSMKARYRANVARTPTEREAVDWQAVIDDVDAGVTGAWNMRYSWFGDPFWNLMAAQFSNATVGWAQMSYQMHGMADQSGMYQDWLSITPHSRMPDFENGEPRLIITPDLRFPQGATEEEQVDNPGTNFIIGHKSWGQPARGTFRWSYYRDITTDYHRLAGSSPTNVPEITAAEMDLLKAEGLYRLDDFDGAAALVNVTREAAGLSSADPSEPNDGNASCVPRLPDASCGDLWEMLKWEKRMETAYFGVHSVSWYFDGRGWGDLYLGTPLERPVPCLEMEIEQASCDTRGGVGGVGGAPVSSYNFPHEG